VLDPEKCILILNYAKELRRNCYGMARFLIPNLRLRRNTIWVNTGGVRRSSAIWC